MAKWNGLDRRRFPRAKYPCLVIIGKDGEKEEILLTHTENIGVGGVCVALKRKLSLFSAITIELDLLDLENHIKCKGKVVWNVQRKTHGKSKPSFHDTGIEFVDLKEKEHKRLSQIIQNLADQNKEDALH